MAAIEAQPPAMDPLDRGRRALERGDSAFGRALAQTESPEALEGLGIAARWLNDPSSALAAHEGAYRGFRAREDLVGAARCAMWLGMESYLFRSEHAVAAGWLERAERLLAGQPLVAEHGWLALWSGHLELGSRNTREARRRAATAASIARALRILDIETLALALEGLALVSEGRVAEGMRRLDAATATALADEMSDLDAISTTCCYMIDACKRVRDFERALQWCDHVRVFCERWSDRLTFAACRTHYSDLLIWRGDWDEAEREIEANLDDLRAINPARAADALARLGELRRRQGRPEEAAGLLARAERHPVALLARAGLALDRGDPAGALEEAERYLRRVGAQDRGERAPGLEVLVRAHLAAGAPERAREALGELRAIAAAMGTGPLQALAGLAEGLVLTAEGRPEEAAAPLEAAAARFERSGGPLEAGRARLALARALAAADRPRSAGEEARQAWTAFLRLGAAGEARRAAALAAELGAGEGTRPDGLPLTRREREILALVARGRDNHQIAAELVLSVRTVERHVSSVYAKIGASGASARVAATAYAVRHGIA